MNKGKNEKCYDNPNLVEVLLFLLPPVGMYALYKTRSISSNKFKILYGTLGFLAALLAIVSLT